MADLDHSLQGRQGAVLGSAAGRHVTPDEHRLAKGLPDLDPSDTLPLQKHRHSSMVRKRPAMPFFARASALLVLLPIALTQATGPAAASDEMLASTARSEQTLARTRAVDVPERLAAGTSRTVGPRQRNQDHVGGHGDLLGEPGRICPRSSAAKQRVGSRRHRKVHQRLGVRWHTSREYGPVPFGLDGRIKLQHSSSARVHRDGGRLALLLGHELKVLPDGGRVGRSN